jgi:hypothetical protein
MHKLPSRDGLAINSAFGTGTAHGGEAGSPTRRDALKTLGWVGAALVSSAGFGSEAAAAGKMPEDILAGQLIISDSRFPSSWTSAASFAAACKNKNKRSFHFAIKAEQKKYIYPPVQIYYAAFFPKPVNDVEVKFVLYDITNGIQNKAKKGAWEAFLNKKGDRVIFNSVELDKEDLLGEDSATKKYLVTIEHRSVILAKTELILTADREPRSGKVEFSDDDTKKKE